MFNLFDLSKSLKKCQIVEVVVSMYLEDFAKKSHEIFRSRILSLLCLVAHRFGRDEFSIFNICCCFFRQAQWKKSKQLFDIQNSTLPNR